MLARDFLEPLPVHRPNEPLEEVISMLRAGTPIAIPESGGWKLLRPIDVLAFPGSRQLCDVPGRVLQTVDIDDDVDLALIGQQDVWGATCRDLLVGRIDSLRVLRDLGSLAAQESGQALAAAARERLMPRFLHDLANALLVADVADRNDPEAGPAALRHSIALVNHMRALYTAGAEPTASEVDLEALMARMEPMLRTAAKPASIELSCQSNLVLSCEPWRLECVLLNLVLNASEVAQRLEVDVSEHRNRLGGQIEITVQDDGPGFAAIDASRPSAASPLRGHGLPSIRRQIAVLGGRMELDASPLGGALVRIKIPKGG